MKQVITSQFNVTSVYDGDDGISSVRLALDNEHEDFLYDDEGNLVSPVGGATSMIRLYDGQTEVLEFTANVLPSSSGATAYVDHETNILHVTALTADAANVVVTTEYNGTDYFAIFTANKTRQDKYDLVVDPSSIAYNPDTYTTKTIKVYADVTTLAGGTTRADISTASPAAGSLCLFARYKRTSSGEVSFVQLTSKGSDGKFSVTVDGDVASWNDGIYLELRQYDGLSSYAVRDYETVEIAFAKNGENSVRLALDNEHEDFLYSDKQVLPIAPSGGATSRIHLYDGPHEITSGVTPVVDFTKSSGVPGSSESNKPTISNWVLTVPHLTLDAAKVTVKATYNNLDYYAEFTANKTNQDKYDIVVNPSSVAYNSATYPTNGQTIAMSYNRTTLQGTQETGLTPSTSKAKDNVCVYYSYVKNDGTKQTPALNFIDSLPFTLSKANAGTYAGVYFELRKLGNASGTTYRMCDYETVEIAKAENGEGSVSATATPDKISVPCTNGGLVVSNVVTTIAFGIKQGSQTYTPTSVTAQSYDSNVYIVEDVTGSANRKKLTVKKDVSMTSLTSGIAFNVTYNDNNGINITAPVSVSIIPSCEGEKGETGRMFYMMGDWDASEEYTRTDEVVPMVFYNDGEWNDYLEVKGSYFYLVASKAQGNNQAPGNTTYWKRCDDFGVVITQGLFADFAKLGSGIFSGDWLFSEHGKIGSTVINSSNPNYSGKKGYLYFDASAPQGSLNLSISGSVSSTSATRVGGYIQLSSGCKVIRVTGNVNGSGQTMIVAVRKVTKGATNLGYVNFTSTSEQTKDIVIKDIDNASDYYIAANMTGSGSGSISSVELVSFAPNYAVDLLTGKTYQNDAYVRGQIVATSGQITGDMDITGTLTLGTEGADNHYIKFMPNSVIGASIIGYSGEKNAFSLGFIAKSGNVVRPALRFNGGAQFLQPDDLYITSINGSTTNDGNRAELISYDGSGNTGRTELYLQRSVSGVTKYIKIGINSSGVAYLQSNCWASGPSQTEVGGFYVYTGTQGVGTPFVEQ